MTTSISPPDTVPEEKAARHRMPFWVNQRLGLLVLVIALSVLFGVLRPAFLDQQLVLFPLLRDVATLTVVALAQMVALSVGHMNLAVGRMAAFGAMFAGLGYDRLGVPMQVGLLLCLAAGAAIGAVTGWLIARTGVSSFVVTLAMDFALLGLVSLLYSALTDDAAFTTHPSGIDELRSYSLADICAGPICGSPAVPQIAQFTVLAMLGLGFLYGCTRIGRELLLTGANPAAAELSGIPTGRRVLLAHTLSGCSPRSPDSWRRPARVRSAPPSATTSCCPPSWARCSAAPCSPAGWCPCWARCSAPPWSA
jgi:ribose transport system permease protein